jgi:hypothetical protein
VELFVGIDVAKETIDICVRPYNIRMSFPNDDQERAEMARLLAETKPSLIMLEASGGIRNPRLRSPCAPQAQCGGDQSEAGPIFREGYG